MQEQASIPVNSVGALAHCAVFQKQSEQQDVFPWQEPDRASGVVGRMESCYGGRGNREDRALAQWGE